MSKFIYVFLVVVSLLTQAQGVRSEILVSEVMYNPQGSDREPGVFEKEWIEIYNSGDHSVNLDGWSIGDAQDGTFADPFPTRTILRPAEALVVTGNAGTFDAQWTSGINRIQVGNFPSLANNPSSTNETVAIRDSSGVVRDEVNLGDSGDWPLINGSDGHSIMLMPNALSASDNNNGANWRPSISGAYGARFSNAGGLGENHASPGVVDLEMQDPFAPSPDAVWSMVVIPDTQNYAKSTVNRHIFTEMTEWIRDNRDTFNIQVVLHEGDIVNNNNTDDPSSGNQTSTQQWENAKASMSVLDGEVPYILTAGNHDFGTTNAQNRFTNLNNYFSASDNPLIDPAQGGILAGLKDPGRLENAYYEFVAPDGREMLVFALEWEPRRTSVAWANSIVSQPEYANHTAILLTHAYVASNETRYRGSRVDADADGEELWQELVRGNANFEMVFNGHFGGDGTGFVESVGDGGNVVHQMFFNTQFLTGGGSGLLRMVEFLEDGQTARIRTYSPYLDVELLNSANQFEIALSPVLQRDYNGDLVVDAGDYTVWRDAVASVNLAADGNGDGRVDTLDYLAWKANFGRSLLAEAGSTAAVPEPLAAVIAGTLLFAGIVVKRCRSAVEQG